MTYQELLSNILSLQEEGIELFNAGKSVLGKNILATHLGDYSGTQILIQAGIHAREWITTLLLVEMVRNLYNNNLVKDGGIYFVFLTNPDGAQIELDGVDSLNCNITREYLTLANGGSADFSQFKANINLVDLNTNFDANWGGGSQNVFCPATEDFVGFYPESEREVQSLVNFTLKTRPLLTISYHSKGNVIYYGFENESEENIERDRDIGEALSETTNYPLIFTENSTGGYKDWCIDELKIPAYTIEVGADSIMHPVGVEYLPEIYNRNKDVPLIALKKANEFKSSIDFMGRIVQNSSDDKVKVKSHGAGYLARLQSFYERRSANWSRNSKK